MNDLKKSRIVSVDSARSDKASPILATFQNANLTQEKCKQTVCKRVETLKEGRKFALIATDSNVYKADMTNSSNAYEDTYLAVHNKDTGEINLIQVQQTSFKHVLYDNTRSIFEQNIVDSKRILQKEFGGKKATSSYDKSQKTQINPNILESTIEKMVDKIDEKIFEKIDEQVKEEEEEEPEQSIYPEIKGNVEGKSVREIFTLDNLLGSTIVEHLSDISLETLRTDPKQLNFSNQYLKNTIEGLQVSKTPESPENINKTSMLIYAQMLIHLINNRRKDLDISKLLRDFSPRLQQDALKKFYIRGSKEYSNFTRQKSIIFYTILMLLSTQSMEMDIKDLLDGMNLPKRELIKYASVLGCKMKGETIYLHKIAKLDKDSKINAPLIKRRRERR